MYTKKIIPSIIIMLTLVASVFALTVSFEAKERDTADNIQGTIYIWDDETGDWVHAAGNQPITVRLWYNDQNGGGLFDIEHLITSDLSSYSHNFEDEYGNHEYCDIVEVNYKGRSYTEYYDGIVRIDVYFDPEAPEPDDGQTEPEEY